MWLWEFKNLVNLAQGTCLACISCYWLLLSLLSVNTLPCRFLLPTVHWRHITNLFISISITNEAQAHITWQLRDEGCPHSWLPAQPGLGFRPPNSLTPSLPPAPGCRSPKSRESENWQPYQTKSIVTITSPRVESVSQAKPQICSPNPRAFGWKGTPSHFSKLFREWESHTHGFLMSAVHQWK